MFGSRGSLAPHRSRCAMAPPQGPARGGSRLANARQVGRGDLALKLLGRDSSACEGTVTCTFGQQLERGGGAIWEQWDLNEVSGRDSTRLAG